MSSKNDGGKRQKPTKQDIRLGRHIQKIRKEKGLTQEDLAYKINKSVTWVGYIENGYRIPNLKLLYKIARVLDVKVRDLFTF